MHKDESLWDRRTAFGRIPIAFMDRLNSPTAATMADHAPAVWEATLLHIYLSSGHDYWGRQGEGRLQHGIQEVAQVECLPGRGLLGDRYSLKKAGHKGQVTFMDADVVEQIRVRFKLPRLPASVFRRNLIVRGVKLGDWLGRRFEFQGVEFEGVQECHPCHWMDRVVTDGAEAFLKDDFRGGLRAKILSSGLLHASPE